jgi:hypothetical protein
MDAGRPAARHATPADVHAAVEQAGKVYSLFGASDKLAPYEPWDYNRLPDKSQDYPIEWMGARFK